MYEEKLIISSPQKSKAGIKCLAFSGAPHQLPVHSTGPQATGTIQRKESAGVIGGSVCSKPSCLNIICSFQPPAPSSIFALRLHLSSRRRQSCGCPSFQMLPLLGLAQCVEPSADIRLVKWRRRESLQIPRVSALTQDGTHAALTSLVLLCWAV